MINQKNNKLCEICGTILRENNKKFCSLKCASKKGCNIIKNNLLIRINNYDKNPKLCRYCNKPLNYKQRHNTYCSHKCSAKLNNVGIVRNGKPHKICLSCGKKIYKWNNGEQRCVKCEIEYKITNNIQVNYRALRAYLIKIRGHQCKQCRNTEWNNLPIPIDLHHIDGNENNNIVSNGKLLCKNCHAQTDTYGAKKRK